MIDVALQSLLSGVHIVVLDPKLLTGLFDDGGYLGVVWLYDPWEQVVSGLMVESSSAHVPEPAVSGIVLCCSNLHLSPESKTHVISVYLVIA